MIELGKHQTLVIVKKVEFGVYLAEKEAIDTEDRVLLPIKQVKEDAQIGDEVEVFIYRDSKDRIIATIKEPKLTLSSFGILKVSQVGTFGAFLDWGLEKDLLLPFKQQTRKVLEGEEILVALYIDKSSRLCATMNVYPYLDQDSPYKKDDKVNGVVYEISREFGAFVAIDYKYSGLIPQKEMYGDINIGDVITARVTEVKEDGKLDLSIREKAYLQIGADAIKIMELIDSHNGTLSFNDKASPDIIKQETGMSKNEFKRAVGNLLKGGKIKITKTGILKL